MSRDFYLGFTRGERIKPTEQGQWAMNVPAELRATVIGFSSRGYAWIWVLKDGRKSKIPSYPEWWEHAE